jgi:hypothetical protein
MREKDLSVNQGNRCEYPNKKSTTQQSTQRVFHATALTIVTLSSNRFEHSATSRYRVLIMATRNYRCKHISENNGIEKGRVDCSSRLDFRRYDPILQQATTD